MEHLFIVNPAAGKGKSLEFIPEIKRVFAGKAEDFHIEITRYPGHATEIARSYASRGTYRIYSVGGDGTLNEVLNGMAESGSSIAVIPAGSGNDFLKSIVPGKNRSDIVGRTVEGVEKTYDLGLINGRYFLNISSLGFDADVVHNTKKLKRVTGIGGGIGYTLGIFLAVAKLNNRNMQITVDGQSIMQKSLLAAVANGRFYGGGMMPVPSAALDDGFLDICLIKGVSRLKILVLFPLFIKGRHGILKEVSFLRGREISIKCEEDTPLNVDGELYTVREAVFKIIAGGIRIVVPAGA